MPTNALVTCSPFTPHHHIPHCDTLISEASGTSSRLQKVWSPNTYSWAWLIRLKSSWLVLSHLTEIPKAHHVYSSRSHPCLRRHRHWFRFDRRSERWMRWSGPQYHRFIQGLPARREMRQDYRLFEEPGGLIFKAATSVNATEAYQVVDFTNGYWAYCLCTSSRCY